MPTPTLRRRRRRAPRQRRRSADRPGCGISPPATPATSTRPAARDIEGRTRASAGLLTEATPVFAEPANAVAYGGVLTALPMLLREGLLGAANRLFRLPAGFYGLTTILLFVA